MCPIPISNPSSDDDTRAQTDITSRKSLRVFAISDIHTDCAQNMQLMLSLSSTEYQNDVLIVAGDIADDLSIFQATLQNFVSKFKLVFFVPGNHDLWCKKHNGGDANSSIDKMYKVNKICDQLGVLRGPHLIEGTENSQACWIVPLLSWYHCTFDTEPDLHYLNLPPVNNMMRDFYSCVWPTGMDASGERVAQYMDLLNDRATAQTPSGRLTGKQLWQHIRDSGVPVISYSHFLPRLELIPEKRFLFFPHLAKAVGSRFLGERVARLNPDVHIFGHTHFGWDMVLDGVRYIQAAVGYPRERNNVNSPLGIGLSTKEPAPKEPLLIFDSTGDGRFQNELSAKWSDFYKTHPREPCNLKLASWVRPHYQKEADEWERAQGSNLDPAAGVSVHGSDSKVHLSQPPSTEVTRTMPQSTSSLPSITIPDTPCPGDARRFQGSSGKLDLDKIQMYLKQIQC